MKQKTPTVAQMGIATNPTYYNHENKIIPHHRIGYCSHNDSTLLLVEGGTIGSCSKKKLASLYER